MSENYSELEVHCTVSGIRHWIDNNDYEWFTDMDRNFLGESVEEALTNLKDN